MASLVNALVFVEDDPRFFGKIVEYNSTHASVEFFLSVADREVVKLPIASIKHAALQAQTRVFVKASGGIWRVGRVVDKFKEITGLFDYTIQFPNNEVAELSECDCYVRCLDRYADPSKILAALCIETEFFAEHRRRAMRRLRALTSAAHGLTAVISAAVKLLPHQVATVRRVVTDRKPRYLLADEVGLGKTIEAGLILRQFQLDDPTRRFVVAVPALLVSQWETELGLKCLVAPERVSVITHEDLRTLSLSDAPDMIVVDEAHRLVEPDMVGAIDLASRNLAKLAARVPRLLLLSATPVLGDESKLLALLHLLDPENYRLDDLSGFKRRVSERQEIGRLLLAMRPDARAFIIRQQLATAKAMFPADSVISAAVDKISVTMDDEIRSNLVADLRDHIASTYRLHQRLIRSRRVDLPDLTMSPRGPDWPDFRHVRYCHLNEDSAATVAEVLDQWRGEATLILDELPELTPEVTRRWELLLENSWHGPTAVAELARSVVPLFDNERPLLRRLAALQGTLDDRAKSVAQVAVDWISSLRTELDGKPRKIACFVSDAELARRIFIWLKKALGESRVLALTGSPVATIEILNEFSESALVRILVCDRESEEGLNLQFVHGILHADIPADATRLEQRVGRLDRFGRTMRQIEHRVILPDDNDEAPWAVWLSLLANGFRIFHRSISDVQFKVEELRLSISRKMIINGAHDLDSLIDETVLAIEAERQKLDEQHILEGVAKLVESGTDLVNAIQASEEDEQGLERDMNAWIKNVVGLTVAGVPPSENCQFAYSWTDATVTPAIPWRQVLKPSLTNRWTWRRKNASRPGVRRAFLARPGSSLCEALERIVLWDDRGISYATWRIENDWVSPWRGFRLVWVIEPALPLDGPIHLRRVDAETARRATDCLPVITFEQVVDVRGTPVDDPQILEILARGYQAQQNTRAPTSINLGSRPELLRAALDNASLDDVVPRVIEVAKKGVMNHPEVVAKLAFARQQCEREVTRARREFEIRSALAASGSVVVEAPSQIDFDAIDKLLHAVAHPNVRLDEIGFYLIAKPAQ